MCLEKGLSQGLLSQRGNRCTPVGWGGCLFIGLKAELQGLRPGPWGQKDSAPPSSACLCFSLALTLVCLYSLLTSKTAASGVPAGGHLPGPYPPD